MTRTHSCSLCGSEDGVAVSLVEWREPIDGRRFESLPRCRDRRACQERVALIGDEWPLVEPKRVPA